MISRKMLFNHIPHKEYPHQKIQFELVILSTRINLYYSKSSNKSFSSTIFYSYPSFDCTYIQSHTHIHSISPSFFFFISFSTQKKVPIIENTVCQDMFEHAGHKKKILPSFLCAGYANGQKDSCEVSTATNSFALCHYC